MSYILEALKKSERERSRVNIATLQTSSQVVFNNRSLWIGMLIGGVALAAVATAAWLVGFRLDHTGPVSAVPPATESSSASGAAPARSVDSAGRPRLPESAPEPAAEASRARRVDGMSDLDPSARARIQGLSLNVVSYSDVPSRRFIMVNQRIVRESETVGDGIVVKRILPGGALLGVGSYEVMVRPE